MQPQMPPYYPPQPAPYPYAYPALPVPPAKQYPIPAGRHVPLIWGISLSVLAVVAALLALGGGLLRPLAPAPYGNTVYASNLAQDDGAWQLATDANNGCAFANGNLDATADATVNTFSPSCTLRDRTVSDFRLSVRLLPITDASRTLFDAVFVRSTSTSGVAFVVSNAGLIRGYVSAQQSAVLTVNADQWHADSPAANVLVIQAQGNTYTLAMNGVEVYSGDLNGFAEGEASSGGIALSAVPPNSGSTEARFADFSLTTP